MINGYEYKIINNEKILILYLDYDNEFGIDFRSHHKNSTMKKEIKNYIKKNNIKLDGEKIALSIGGIILAVLLVVETPTQEKNLDFAYVSDTIIPEINEVIIIPPTVEKPENDVVEDNTIKDENESNQESSNNENTTDKVENNKPNKENTNSTNNIQNNNINNENKENVEPPKDNITNNNNQNNNTSNNSNSNITDNTSNSNPNTNTNTNHNQQNTSENKPATSEKQVTIYRTNGDVITLSLEEYLIGVVGAEMPASFSKEALKAQAIVSRTYALKRIQSGDKLTDSVSTQRYKDNNELKKDWGSSYDTYYQKIKSAVEETKGLAIYYQGNYIDAVYHSTSNGKTEDAVNVWGNSIPYLKSVDSNWDKTASSYLREVSKELSNVLTILGITNDNSDISILSRNESGRVLEIKVGDKNYSGVEFRNLLGLRSADFDIDISNGNLIITTRGYGHGVGLSQYGANGMAKEGYTYNQILKHYYTGVSIK